MWNATTPSQTLPQKGNKRTLKTRKHSAFPWLTKLCSWPFSFFLSFLLRLHLVQQGQGTALKFLFTITNSSTLEGFHHLQYYIGLCFTEISVSQTNKKQLNRMSTDYIGFSSDQIITQVPV